MAHIKIAEAARIAGISRTSMNRALQSGKVSYSTNEKGVRLIDPAEVARAYPGTAGTPQRNDPGNAAARPADMVVEQLLARISDQDRTIADLRSERDRLLGMLEQREQRLLPAPSWWRRWRAR